MAEEFTIETDRFEHREVKPHFINPCCFGEDLAAWLREQLRPLANGIEISEPIQEDYGWGLWVSHGKDAFWIALSYVGDGPTEEPAQWVVSVRQERFRRFWRRFIPGPDQATLKIIRDRVREAMENGEGIRVVEEE